MKNPTKKRSAWKHPRKRSSTIRKDYVVVSNRSYGNKLRGIKIYFEGPERPAILNPDGRLQFGKHILETLISKYRKFRLILTQNTDSITEERGIVRVRVSLRLLRRMSSENWDRSRDIKNDIVQRFFSAAFPQEFTSPPETVYVPGTLSGMLDTTIIPKLSSHDKEALNNFLPDFLSAEAAASVSMLRAAAEIRTLKELADNLEAEMAKAHTESWWQTYIKGKILLMQHGYIGALEKLNVAIGITKLPDFCLITHDSYLDILEIKKPDTNMLKHDPSRDNYYWDSELSKAISQTENYIEQVSNKADAVRSYLKDREGIEMKVVRPRGIILAGDARTFTEQKQRDDFRLLSQGIKNIAVLTYDELLARVKNYINVLERFAKPGNQHLLARQ